MYHAICCYGSVVVEMNCAIVVLYEVIYYYYSTIRPLEFYLEFFVCGLTDGRNMLLEPFDLKIAR